MRFFQDTQTDKIYAVAEVVASQETGEQFVVYTDTSDAESRPYVVPFAMFFGEVIDKEGNPVSRVVPYDPPKE